MNSQIMNKEIAIQAEQITKTFGDFTAVDHISFEVKKGEIFGFLGANGAGKTTAMRMFCGLSTPTSGKAMVAGFDVYKNAEEIKKNLGDAPEILNYQDPSILAEVREHGYVTAGAAARLVGMYMQAVSDGADAVLNCCSSVGNVSFSKYRNSLLKRPIPPASFFKTAPTSELLPMLA